MKKNKGTSVIAKNDDEKVCFTFEQYDDLVEKFLAIDHQGYVPYWPTQEEIHKYEEILSKKEMVMFIIWLTEKNPDPDNYNEVSSMEVMKDFLYKNLELVDSGSGGE